MAFTISGRRHPRAGRSADAHYRDKLATWQKRVLPRMRWVLWPVIGLGLIGAWLPGMWKWAAGLWCGAAFALWIAWKDDAPARIDNWHWVPKANARPSVPWMHWNAMGGMSPTT